MKINYHLVWILSLLLIACSDRPYLPALGNDAVIVAFGDSLTRGYGAKESDSYPAVLEKLTGRTVINAGITGEESLQGLLRLPEVLENYQPDLLILCHGGNDILRKRDLQTMANNLREMILMANRKKIPVIMLAIPKPGILLSALPVYREIADSMEVLFIEDLISDVLGDGKMKSDAVHPNKEGYRKIAEGIYTILQESGAI